MGRFATRQEVRRRKRWSPVVALAAAAAAALVTCGSAAALAAPGADAARRHAPGARVLTRDEATVLRTGRLRIRLSGPRRSRVRVRVSLSLSTPTARRSRRRARPTGPAMTARRAIRLNRRGSATLTLVLTAAGRQAVRAGLASCRPLALTIDLRARRRGRRRVRRHGRLSPGSCQLGSGSRSTGLMTPAGGFPAGLAGLGKGKPASFRVGAATVDFSPPTFGHAPGGDPANCDPTGAFNGPRRFAFIEPYKDLQGSGHYDGPSPPFPGDPYIDCNQNSRWDGNLLGGGSGNPRFYSTVADPVTARAMVVSNGQQTVAIEVVDQEGLFNIYQQQIRDKVATDGYKLDGIFISATHDESAPDTLGLGGVTSATSGVNDYFLHYFIDQSALAIEQAYQGMRPATLRYTEVLEPANMRQCWSSYPFVDDQHMPVVQAVGDDGKVIATLASVSQHAETLGFNGGSQKDGAFTLDQEKNWVSADWPYFFSQTLEQHYGGVAIEMAGSVGSVESPEVYPSAISRTPQKFLDVSHPAGCRTLFQAGGQDDTAGSAHVPLGYHGETQAFGQQMAGPIIAALDAGSYYPSTSNDIWGARANVCIPLDNQLFAAAATAGVFAHRPGYNSDCSQQFPVAPNGSTSGTNVLTQVAAFRIGDGQFVSIPGEVFPFTYLRSFLGPEDMPNSTSGLPPWLIPHMHTPFRFIDGLAEDMIGYIFPQGNAVGIPNANNPNSVNGPADRFGCAHSDDSESASGSAADRLGQALVPMLDQHGGTPEKIVTGRYVFPDGTQSRNPLGTTDSIECNPSTGNTVFKAAGPASAVELVDGTVFRPRFWMSLSGLPQTAPDRDTRGYFDAQGNRVWLEVFPDVKLP